MSEDQFRPLTINTRSSDTLWAKQSEETMGHFMDITTARDKLQAAEPEMRISCRLSGFMMFDMSG